MPAGNPDQKKKSKSANPPPQSNTQGGPPSPFIQSVFNTTPIGQMAVGLNQAGQMAQNPDLQRYLAGVSSGALWQQQGVLPGRGGFSMQPPSTLGGGRPFWQAPGTPYMDPRQTMYQNNGYNFGAPTLPQGLLGTGLSNSAQPATYGPFATAGAGVGPSAQPPVNQAQPTTGTGAGAQGVTSDQGPTGPFNPSYTPPYVMANGMPFGTHPTGLENFQNPQGQGTGGLGTSVAGANVGNSGGGQHAQADPLAKWKDVAANEGINWDVLVNTYVNPDRKGTAGQYGNQDQDIAAAIRNAKEDGAWAETFAQVNNGTPPNTQEWTEHWYAKTYGYDKYRDPIINAGHNDAVALFNSKIDAMNNQGQGQRTQDTWSFVNGK